MNKIIKDALILTLITLVAGTALGAVYQITKEPIAKANEAAVSKAKAEVFADAASFEELDGFDAKAVNKALKDAGYSDGKITSCEITACDTALGADGAALGYVVSVTSHAGYGGDIEFLVGVTNEGTLNGYSITTIGETAGLGMKATEPKFGNQFVNIEGATKSLLEVVKSSDEDPTTIEAISGATITSKAMTYGVDAALFYVNTLIGGDSNE